MKDALAFIILHSHFIVFSFILLKQAKGKILTNYIIGLLLVFYSITILASLARAGDDFAWFHYFFMYAFVPFIYFYCKSTSYERYGKCIAISLFVVLPALALAGVATLFIALLVAPPSWN